MKLLSLFILFLVAGGTCLAQLSLPDVTDTLFDRTDGSLNSRPLLLAPFADGLSRTGIALQGEDQQTVRQTQPGRGVLEDLHANSSGAIVRVGSGSNRLWGYLHAEHLSDSGTLDQPPTTIGLSGNLDETDAAVIWPIQKFTLRMGYEHDRYSAGGQSSLYANLFDIFPPEPPLSLDKREDLGTASLAFHVASAWIIEADLGVEGSPGHVALTSPSSPANLIIPLSDHGASYLYTLEYMASRESSLYAFAGSGSFHGSGNITTNLATVGQSADSRLTRTAGLAWRRRFGGSRELTLYAEQDQQRWAIHGGVPNPSQIGIDQPYAHDLFFNAGYDVRDEIAGLSWSQSYGANHSLYLDYRFGEIQANVTAGEGLILFLFPAGQETNQSIDNLNGHILQVRYRFPLWKMQATLGALQVIPATSRASTSGITTSSGGGSGAGGGALGPRHTYGGWALTWQLGYSF